MLTITCKDPKKGEIDYEISPFIFTPDSLQLFWEKSSQYTTLFNSEIRSDFKKFLEIFMGSDKAGGVYAKGLFWRIDTKQDPLVGAFYMTDIELPVQATVHFSFFDGRIRGRAPLAKEMLKFVFREYDLVRLNAELPVYVNKAAFRFVEEIGFSKEGRKRRAVEFDNKYFDTVMFGILREEVLNGS